jgi:hypothetical protein
MAVAERTDHVGDPLPPDAYFFAPPPPEIGDIRSAYSSLKSAKAQSLGTNRLVGTVIWTAVIGFLGIGALFLLDGMRNPLNLIWVVLVAALAGLIAFFNCGKATCSYVGTLGTARYTALGDPNWPKSDIFLFRTARELRTTQTRNYYNGVYTGTTYTFAWTDEAGKRVYNITGQHNANKGIPKGPHPFNFARAAELSWSNFLLPTAQHEYETLGYVQFNLGGKDWVRVGPQCVELFQRGQVQQCPTANIATFSINQGVFTVRLKDAKSGFLGIGSKGIFSFNYAGMANARLFLFVMGELAGIQLV